MPQCERKNDCNGSGDKTAFSVVCGTGWRSLWAIIVQTWYQPLIAKPAIENAEDRRSKVSAILNLRNRATEVKTNAGGRIASGSNSSLSSPSSQRRTLASRSRVALWHSVALDGKATAAAASADANEIRPLWTIRLVRVEGGGYRLGRTHAPPLYGRRAGLRRKRTAFARLDYLSRHVCIDLDTVSIATAFGFCVEQRRV